MRGDLVEVVGRLGAGREKMLGLGRRRNTSMMANAYTSKYDQRWVSEQGKAGGSEHLRQNFVLLLAD